MEYNEIIMLAAPVLIPGAALSIIVILHVAALPFSMWLLTKGSVLLDRTMLTGALYRTNCLILPCVLLQP